MTVDGYTAGTLKHLPLRALVTTDVTLRASFSTSMRTPMTFTSSSHLSSTNNGESAFNGFVCLLIAPLSRGYDIVRVHFVELFVICAV